VLASGSSNDTRYFNATADGRPPVSIDSHEADYHHPQLGLMTDRDTRLHEQVVALAKPSTAV